MDLCRLNPLKCLHNGNCTTNYSSNTTYCACDPCFVGDFCQQGLWQTKYNTDYANLIIYIFWLCISVLNNGMCLELFIRSKSLRYTNRGVYLIMYSILSLLASILLVTEYFVIYDNSIFNGNQYALSRFRCAINVAGYSPASLLCVWFSALIQLEHARLLRHNNVGDFTRQPIIASAVLFAIAIGCCAPLVFYNCDWKNVPHLKTARTVIVLFHACTAGIIYVVSLNVAYFSIANRIRRYGVAQHSYMKTFFRLSFKHFFIFVPVLVFLACYVPINAVTYFSKPGVRFLECGISLPLYITKVLLNKLLGAPFNLTWLIFVYPSKVYMTEFYTITWCGQWTARIVLAFRQCYPKKKHTDPVVNHEC